MQGDRSALRLCIEGIKPARRGAVVTMNLPPIKTAEDVDKAAQSATQASGSATVHRPKGTP
jgi:hypothetical protein